MPANLNIQMKHFNGTDWDSLNPKTLASNVSTSDASDVQTKLNTLNTTITNKVDKVTGMGLSTNDFSNTYKTKLDSVQTISVNATQPTDGSTLWYQTV